MSQQVNWGKRPSKQPEGQGSPAALDDFVNPKRKTKRLNAEIDAGLHGDFKAECARQPGGMTAVLNELIDGWLKKRRNA